MSTISSSSNSTIHEGYEPIPGYRVESLLGRGGFGEVWKCEAPGGLKKAIKFVFGSMDEDRASRELKSLNRIKGVQHPFLLTLERFEFVEGRLVIVTELADGSLEDEFNKRRASGSCGIPRDQLIARLSDAADALDYLHERHGLLHLDVKPGNLLVLADHVKVADFGLVKDLKELECSIVGGLTPVYAPPELFDGRPSLHSDQYSLAVMFQEMLTGVRPFVGRTIAQLATQHVHAAPNLTPLLPADRPILARALEKNPERRFSSCREFIDTLRQSVKTRERVSSDQPGSICDLGVRRASDTAVGQFPGLIGGPAVKIDDLPSLKVGSQLVRRDANRGIVTKHALVIAMGGMGVDCLQKLQMMSSQSIEDTQLALHGLVIDTDHHALQQVSDSDWDDSRGSIRSLFVPLRKPQEYREFQGERLRSISRRWVFNVPRSGVTEGMRPLGRLALVDHGPKVSLAIQDVVRQYRSLVSDQAPAVYVVGSIDGGTASGMVFDVVHLVRHWLDQVGMEHAKVLPLLATRSLSVGNVNGLAGHNAGCALGELRHFVKIANGYPGDSAAGWPNVPAARSPLNDAYIVSASSEAEEAYQPAETIAQYIFLDSVFAGDVLEAARLHDSEKRLEDLASPMVRSVGIAHLGIEGTIVEALFAPLITLRLLSQWVGQGDPCGESVQDFFSKFVPYDQLTCESVIRSCLGQWSDNREERLAAMKSWFQTLSPDLLADSKTFNAALAKLADQTFGDAAQRDRIAVWNVVLQELLNELAHRRISLEVALAIVDRLIDLISSAQAVLESQSTSDTDFLTDSQAPLPDKMVFLSERWLWRSACQIAGQTYAELMVALATTKNRLQQRYLIIHRVLEGLKASLVTRNSPTWDEMDASWQLRAESAVRRLNGRNVAVALITPILKRDVDDKAKDILNQLLQDAISIATELQLADEPVAEGDAETNPISNQLDFVAYREVLESRNTALQSLSSLPMHSNQAAGDWFSSQGVNRGYKEAVETAIKAVHPPLLSCGGSQRMLLLVGDAKERERWEPIVRQVHGGSLTTIEIPGVAPKLVCEAQKIKLNDVRARVIATIGGRDDVLGRLHTRCDIAWS